MKKHISSAILLSSVAANSFGAVNDIFPTDYVSNNVGDTVATLYMRNSDSKGVYKNGKQILNESAHAQIDALRLSHTVNTFGYNTAFVGVITRAKVKFEGAFLEATNKQYNSGYADSRAGLTTWLVSNNAKMEYLALTTMVSLPTGQYDGNKAFNIGENRYKAIVGGGYVNRFMDNNIGELFFEFSPEVVYYGANNKFQGKKLEQKPSFSMTGYLRYRPVTSAGFFIGGQTNKGGETIVNGKPMGDSAGNTRIMGGVAVFVLGTQVVLRGAKDIGVYNGLRNTNEVTLRLQKTF